jgi:hypothetical protein
MLPEATLQRLIPLLQAMEVSVAYAIAPLPRGVLSASQGGLAVLLPGALAATQRYEQGQRLRFKLIGLLPPGRGEVVVLNDCRSSVAAEVVERGMTIYAANERERLRYEMMVLSRGLEFASTARRFLGPERGGREGERHD